MTDSFHDCLLKQLPGDPSLGLLPLERLEKACQDILKRVKTFPFSQGFDACAFLSYLGTRTEKPDAFLAWPKHLWLDDLFLVYLCLEKQKEAIDFFLKKLLPEAIKLPLKTPAEQDLFQQFVADLLTGPSPFPPKLLQYRGQGKLLHWLRVAWARRKSNLQRGLLREVSLQPWHVERLVGAQDNPELKLLKSQYIGKFKAALTALLEGLSPEEKALLKMRFLENMTLSHIGQVVDLDKASVSRRLQKIREQLFSRLRCALQGSPSEIHSALLILESQQDLSVERLLK